MNRSSSEEPGDSPTMVATAEPSAPTTDPSAQHGSGIASIADIPAPLNRGAEQALNNLNAAK